MKQLTAFLVMLCLAVFVVGCEEDTTTPFVLDGADEAVSDATATLVDDTAAEQQAEDETAAKQAADDAAAEQQAEDEAAAKKAADDAAAEKKVEDEAAGKKIE